MEFTYDQIKAINDAMSFLTIIEGNKDVQLLEEYTNRHCKQLVEAGVDKNIVDHFAVLMHSHISYIEACNHYCG